MNYNEKIGDVVEKTKSVEYYLNCIIGNYISPTRTGFFDNVILNGSIVDFGKKIKVIKTICEAEGIEFDFKNLHELMNIRNLFAHESTYVEFPNGEMLVKMDQLKNDGKYIESTFNDKYNEFVKLYTEEIKNIMKLNQDIIEKCHKI